MRIITLFLLASAAFAKPATRPVHTAPHFEPTSNSTYIANTTRYQAQISPQGFHVQTPQESYGVSFLQTRQTTCDGDGPPLARSNYFLGRNASDWRIWVPQYARLRCPDVYPAIDLIYYFTTDGLIEFDFLLHPGADPNAIRLSTTGKSRHVKLRPPIAWQTQGATRRPVSARFQKQAPNLYAFSLGPFDPTLPLTIDPVIDYSTYLGGSGGASGETVTIDKDGNVYVAGTASTNAFPVTESGMQTIFAGSNDIFVSKFDPSGTTLLYSTYIGSYADDRAVDITTDRDGRLYVVGYSTSPEFPIKNAVQERFAGGSMAAGGDVILFALDPSGSSLLFATYYGGTLDDFGRGIAVAPDGSIIVAGGTNSQDLPLKNPRQETYGGGTRDCFVVKFAPMAESIIYATYLGSGGADEFNAVDTGADGSAYLAGITTSQDLTTVAPFQPRYGGGARDALIAKLSPTGDEWNFLTYLGGTTEDYARALVLDKNENLYITGFTLGGAFPVRNSFDTSYNSNRDAFLVKMPPTGATVTYGTYIGHNSLEDGFAVSVNDAGEAAVAGHTQSILFPAVNAVQSQNGSGCTRQACTADVFLARYSADGRRLFFSSFLGGSGADQSRGLAFAPNGDLWVTGYTASVNFPVPNGLFQRHTGGGANIAFLTRIHFD